MNTLTYKICVNIVNHIIKSRTTLYKIFTLRFVQFYVFILKIQYR
jgi:hypothetical protein